MSLWTDIRDAVQSVAVVVGAYYVPGSSLLTSKLVSKGAQEHLDSDIGQIAQIGASLYGGMQGNNLGNAKANIGKDFGSSAGATSGASSAISANTASTLEGSMATNSARSAGGLGAGGSTAKASTWDKISGFLEKNAMTTMMVSNTAIGAMSGIEASKVAREKAEYERAQRERELANVNSPGIINLRAKPYKTAKQLADPITGLIGAKR